jgi:hypothetical protein
VTALAQAHIEGQRRLRELAGRGVTTIWRELPGYDEDDVDRFLARAVPFVLAAQRQSITLTEAFLARELGRRAIGLDPASIIGAPLRNGAPPEQVYRRPFITVWSKLGNSVPWEEAANAGLARLVSTAETDVQLAMRQTASQVQQRDPAIKGWRRVANPGACTYCQMLDGAFLKSADAMPMHPDCGCGLEPLLQAEAPAGLPSGVAVHDHGELGAVVGDPTHNFTSL